MSSRLGFVMFAAIAPVMLSTAALGQSKPFDQTVDLPPGSRLSLTGGKGDVRIVAWDQPRVQIRARIEAPRDVSADYAERAVEAATVDVNVSARSVTIRSDYDDVPNRSWAFGQSQNMPYIHYEIRAPRDLDLQVDADRGNTEIEGFTGVIDIETDRGTLEVTDLSGEIRIMMDRGERSRLTGLQGSVEIEADRTDITVRGLNLEGDSRLDIDRGTVELEMPASQALSLYAEMSRRANLESDFDITLEQQSPSLLHGTINGGGPELAIDADRASIQLRRSK